MPEAAKLAVNTALLLQLDTKEAVRHYMQSKRRLLVLGYNATLTTAVEAPRQPKRHFDQIKVLSRLQTASVSASVILSQAAKLALPLRGASARPALLLPLNQPFSWCRQTPNMGYIQSCRHTARPTAHQTPLAVSSLGQVRDSEALCRL